MCPGKGQNKWYIRIKYGFLRARVKVKINGISEYNMATYAIILSIGISRYSTQYVLHSRANCTQHSKHMT